jgi:hypothetical protein
MLLYDFFDFAFVDRIFVLFVIKLNCACARLKLVFEIFFGPLFVQRFVVWEVCILVLVEGHPCDALALVGRCKELFEHTAFPS